MTQDTRVRSRMDLALGVDEAKILEAVEYLEHCRLRRRSFAILTAPDKSGVQAAVQRFLAELPPSCRIARTPGPTDSSHTFLENILAQLGFEPFDSTADDLQRLLTVVLRQSASRETMTVIVVEDAQDFGPRVLETIRDLARNSRDTLAAPLIVLTGHGGLNRVLDSRAMASIGALMLDRFDFAAARPFPASREAPESTADATGSAFLELSLNHDVVGRFPLARDRLLIGRGQLSDICIASRFVSRQHALLVRNSDGDWLIDLNSTNGTSVNSAMINHRRLCHGDIVSIGNYRLRYENPAARPQEALAAAAYEELSQTTAMRSLRALQERSDEPAMDGSVSAA